MLFIFPEEGEYGFWMKNTLISLDIIWIDENQKIVHIEKAEPCTEEPCKVYRPTADAIYVLEINSGLTDKLNISIADEVVLKNKR